MSRYNFLIARVRSAPRNNCIKGGAHIVLGGIGIFAETGNWEFSQELRWVLQNLVGMKLPPPGEEDDRFLQNVEEREIGIVLFAKARVRIGAQSLTPAGDQLEQESS